MGTDPTLGATGPAGGGAGDGQPEPGAIDPWASHLVPRVVRVAPEGVGAYPGTPIRVRSRPDRRPSRVLPLLDRPVPTGDAGVPADDRVWRAIDDFNGAVRRLPADLLAARTDAARKMFGPIDPLLVGVFAAADLRAEVLQRRFEARLVGSFAALLGAIVWFGWTDLDDVGILGFLLFLSLAALLIWQGKSRQLENAFLDSRALAEGVRVLGFWRRAGLGQQVTDRYLSHHHEAVDWIRTALAQLEAAVPEPVPADATAVGEVTRNWVVAQRDYFARKLEPTGRRARLWSRFGAVGLVGTVVVAAGYGLFVLRGIDAGTSAVLQAVLAWVGGVAVVAEGFAEKQGFTKLAVQYQLAHRLFERAVTELERGADPAAVYLQLGEEALRENGEWLAYFRNHPLTIKV